MGDPYIGEIRMFGGNFAPQGWLFCNGDLLPISEYEHLFQLIGTTYGGDGITTFALPDLRGRIPIHQGQGDGLTNRTIGEKGGDAMVTLQQNQLPVHTHTHVISVNTYAQAAKSGNSTEAKGNYLTIDPTKKKFGQTKNTETTNTIYTSSTTKVGGNQAHQNLMPSLSIHFIISLYGVFPSQS